MKKIIIAISCCIVLLLLSFCGWRGYQVWKENRLMSLAKICASQGDLRTEFIWLQQVLRVNPRNLEANRRMAMLAQADMSPGAMIWRERVVNLVPDSVEDRLAQAETAMLFKEYTTATNALEAVPEVGKKTPAYLNLAGVIAAALNETGAAEKYFSEAIRVEPDNPVPRLNLSVLRLHSSNTVDMAAARVDLEKISKSSTNSNMRVKALRELLADAIRFKESAAALALASELAAQPAAIFQDKLLRLDVLHENKSPDYGSTLAAYQKDAATNGTSLSSMAVWMMMRSKPESALKWLQSLPADIKTNQPGALLIAECLTMVQSWPNLQGLLEKQDWSELDFLRHAFIARAMREQNLTGTSAAEWSLAVKLANENKSMLISLFRLAAGWNWVDEAEQILWTVVNRYPEEKWAAASLQNALAVGGRTRPLLQFYSQQYKRNPDSVDTLNNLAMMAMLLEASEIKPFELAGKAYDKAPNDSAVLSTYAFSLYLQKQYGEALKIIEKLPPQVLNHPSVAGYYGLILLHNGESQRGKTLLNLALTSGQLLPEEKKLFQQAAAN